VERDHRGHVASFFVETPLVAGAPVSASEAASHHARVKRIEVGARVRVTNGAGKVGIGTIATLARAGLTVQIEEVWSEPAAPPIHLRVPIADRDRMLWLAEKAAEFGVASWQAVRFKRSASVSPRGEGETFLTKVRARMIGALEQSGGSWLPSLVADATPGTVAASPSENRILLDRDGAPLASLLALPVSGAPVILFGPEGGLEANEVSELVEAGWRRASLAATTLRFETAGLAAVAVCHAVIASSGSTEGRTNG
jgi:16S rRNA (uracil1498-N3)-methyltransferase